MPRLYLYILFFLLPMGLSAQVDSGKTVVLSSAKNMRLDSAALNKQQFNRDSLKKIADSLTYFWVKTPDPNRPDRFRDSLMKVYQVYNLDFKTWADKFIAHKNHEGEGKFRKQGERWVILVILLLIIGFALIKNSFRSEIQGILNAFFDQRFLSQAPTTGNFLNSWPFIFLYLLFGFTIGMYLFLAGKFFQTAYILDGMSWYISLSLLIILLFTLKIFLLRLLGFLLQTQKAVKTYISILYLSYFHAAILFLPLILAFSLSSGKYAGIFIYAGIVFTALILAYQLVRVALHVLAHYQFSKFYLFIYFCALEICPILILIKALRF